MGKWSQRLASICEAADKSAEGVDAVVGKIAKAIKDGNRSYGDPATKGLAIWAEFLGDKKLIADVKRIEEIESARDATDEQARTPVAIALADATQREYGANVLRKFKNAFSLLRDPATFATLFGHKKVVTPAKEVFGPPVVSKTEEVSAAMTNAGYSVKKALKGIVAALENEKPNLKFVQKEAKGFEITYENEKNKTVTEGEALVAAKAQEVLDAIDAARVSLEKVALAADKLEKLGGIYADVAREINPLARRWRD